LKRSSNYDDNKSLYVSSFSTFSAIAIMPWRLIVCPGRFFKPWVHLDIAGTDWNEKAQSYLAEGPTGVGVGIMIRLVERLARRRDG
jgi:hypothetical protein